MREIRIKDASDAQSAAIRHLEANYADRIAEIRISKVWYSAGRAMDVWEVEGIVSLKKAVLRKESRRFKFQIDPLTGDVIGFEH